jgi:hypothetical protein
MSASGQTQDASETGAASPAYTEVVVQILVAAGSALVAGITSLTFVAVVGGAVTMARLRGAGLPTEFGVAVQPRTMLLSVGAEALAAAFAFALGALFVVHFVPWMRELVPEEKTNEEPEHPPDQGEPETGGPGTVESKSLSDKLKSLLRSFWSYLGSLCSRHDLWAASVVMLGFVYYVLWSAGAFHFPLQTVVAGLMLLFAVVVGYVAGRTAAKAVHARDRRHDLTNDRALEAERAPGHARLARMEIMYLAGMATTIILFATVAAVTASLADPKVRPAAVLFAEHRVPLCGVFIAQDSEHLYIGLAEKGPLRNIGDHSRGRILDLPRDEVRALAVGSSRSLPDALARRRDLLEELALVHRVPIPAASLSTCPP